MKYPTPEERLLATQPQPEPQPGDMPSPAHDTEAPKLRERLARAENANNDERDSWSHTYAILTGRRYGEGYSLRDLTNIAQAVVTERDSFRAEADRLREQVERLQVTLATAIIDNPSQYVWAGASPFTGNQVLDLLNENESLRKQVAALQPYADMAAGLLAEKQARVEREAQMNQKAEVLRQLQSDPNYNGTTMVKRDDWVNPSPRLDAQEETR